MWGMTQQRVGWHGHGRGGRFPFFPVIPVVFAGIVLIALFNLAWWLPFALFGIAWWAFAGRHGGPGRFHPRSGAHRGWGNWGDRKSFGSREEMFKHWARQRGWYEPEAEAASGADKETEKPKRNSDGFEYV